MPLEGRDHVCLIWVPRAWGGPSLRGDLSELWLTMGARGSVCGCTGGGQLAGTTRGAGSSGLLLVEWESDPLVTAPFLPVQASKEGDSGDSSQPHWGAHSLRCPSLERPMALELYWAS